VGGLADRERVGVQPSDGAPVFGDRRLAGASRPRPATDTAGLEDWLAERFRRHAGNAEVVRQELEREKGIRLTLRTVEREVSHRRRELEAEARATIGFETPPGKQLQIDFGERRVLIAGENVKVYLFVATLGYSRQLSVRRFRNERQESWFAGVEGGFRHFGGVTEGVLLDNDRGLVARHDRETGEVEFKARRHAFAKHWGFRPRVGAPDWARTKSLPSRKRGARTSGASARSRRTPSPGAMRSVAGIPAFETTRELVRRCKPIAWSRSTAMPIRCGGG
jgi:transposase